MFIVQFFPHGLLNSSAMLPSSMIFAHFTSGSLWQDYISAIHTERINLSPFTKDFRVWVAPLRTCYFFHDWLLRKTVNLSQQKKNHLWSPIFMLTMPLKHQHNKIVFNTLCSQAVTHPSTHKAQCCLTSVIRRELVFSTWYGRRHEAIPILAVMTLVEFLYSLRKSCMDC